MAGKRLRMAIRRRADVTNEQVVGLVPRRSRSAWAHLRFGAPLGLTATLTSGVRGLSRRVPYADSAADSSPAAPGSGRFATAPFESNSRRSV